MHWVELDGHVLPGRVGGDPALDFCNTWAGWDAPPAPEREWLRDYAALATWSTFAELIPAAAADRLRAAALDEPDRADRCLDEVRALRDDLYRVLLDPADTDAFAQVAAVAQRAAAAARLELAEHGARWYLPDEVGLDLPLLAVARAAADLLSRGDQRRVRRCPGDECGWLFLDTRGRRRWCSMATCGNRAKVRAYQLRHSEPAH